MGVRMAWLWLVKQSSDKRPCVSADHFNQIYSSWYTIGAIDRNKGSYPGFQRVGVGPKDKDGVTVFG